MLGPGLSRRSSLDEPSDRIAHDLEALAICADSGEELVAQIRVLHPTTPLFVLRTAACQVIAQMGQTGGYTFRRLQEASCLLEDQSSVELIVAPPDDS